MKLEEENINLPDAQGDPISGESKRVD